MNAVNNTAMANFLNESERQITGLSRSSARLGVHNDKFLVVIDVRIGLILNQVEEVLKNKKDYMAWVRATFPHNHIRNFQQARQLAKHSDSVLKVAALGKNRNLELIRLIDNYDSLSYETLLDSYPFQDTTLDFDGDLFKRHVDGIITLHRFKAAGVDFITFEHAWLMASFSGGSVKVGRAKQLEKWIHQQEIPVEALDHLVMNMLVIPYDSNDSQTGPRQSTYQSIDKLLLDVIEYEQNVQLDDPGWIEKQKGIIEIGNVIKAHRFIRSLAEKLDIKLDESSSTETTTIGGR